MNVFHRRAIVCTTCLILVAGRWISAAKAQVPSESVESAAALSSAGLAESPSAPPSSTQRQRFRLDSSIFADDSPQPISRHRLYINEQAAYGVQLGADADQPQQAVVIPHNPALPITLVAVDQEIVTQVSRSVVLQLNREINDRASAMEGLVRFSAIPEFQPRWNTKGNQLTMHSALLRYVVEVADRTDDKPTTKSASDRVRAYWDFADWTSRLNAVQPGGLPSEARLQLNRELADRGTLPRTVEVRRRLSADGPVQRLRSTHECRDGLSEGDLAEIAKIDGWADQFDVVDFSLAWNVSETRQSAAIQR